MQSGQICARVISTYMEFTLTRGLQLEFKNAFKYKNMSCTGCVDNGYMIKSKQNICLVLIVANSP